MTHEFEGLTRMMVIDGPAYRWNVSRATPAVAA